jgi:polysaccharide deacetylase family protein (PEP-CTERM system associated)
VLNALSVDIEEYFHPSEIQAYVKEEQWAHLPSRIELQTMDVLELFAAYNVKATFFILGWIAERYPGLVRTIADAGHEIGCHSFAHQLVYRLSPEEFRSDTRKAVEVIAAATGRAVTFYRAPSYSITAESLWALDTLAELGFTYDSSIYPVVHDRYGIPGSARNAHTIKTRAGTICEVPIATVAVPGGRVLPVGGGAYLRLLPYRYTAAGIRRLNEDERQPACIYFHPWELDPDQPRIASGAIASLRTYTGLKTMRSKLIRLINEFSFSTIGKVFSTFAG